jgi:hypothetical protein
MLARPPVEYPLFINLCHFFTVLICEITSNVPTCCSVDRRNQDPACTIRQQLLGHFSGEEQDKIWLAILYRVVQTNIARGLSRVSSFLLARLIKSRRFLYFLFQDNVNPPSIAHLFERG